MRAETIVRPLLLIAVIGAAACGFSASQSNPDGGLDVISPPTIGFAEATSLEDEESGAVMIPVILSAPASVPITVTYAIVGGSATNGVDYTGSGGILTFQPGDLQQAIPLTIHMDPDEAEDEDILFELRAPTGGAILAGKHHTLTISADILPRVYFTQMESMNLEGFGTITVNVALDRVPTVGANIPFTVTGTASHPADHTLANGSVTFAIDQVSRTIAIPVVQDLLNEDDETVIITLNTGTNAVLGTAKKRTHTIIDDDPLPIASFMVDGSSVVEGETTVAVTVRLDVVSGRDVTIPLIAGAGTATVGEDFDYPAIMSVTIPEGMLSTTFLLTIKDDLIDEDDETVIVHLGPSPTATVTGTPTYTLTITDNDDPPTVRFDPTQNDGDESESETGPFDYRVVLSGISAKLVTVGVSFDGSTATQGSDYTIRANDIPVTFAPGQTLRTIQVTVIDDDVMENANGGSELIRMTLINPTNATLGSPTLRTHRIRDDD